MASADTPEVTTTIGQPATSSSRQSVVAEERTPKSSSKRQKITRACDSCKTRKRRCTGELPCQSCCTGSSDIECTYNASYTRGRLVQPLRTTHAADPAGQDGSSRNRETLVQRVDPAQAKPSIDPASGAGSNSRASRAASPEGEATTLAGQYAGPTSAYSFLRRAWRRFGLSTSPQQDRELNQAVPIFSYGDKHYPRSSQDASGLRLPDRFATAGLLANYFDFAMPTYRFLHQPTVAVWLETLHAGLEGDVDRVSLFPVRQAIVLMVLATASLFKVDGGLEDGQHAASGQEGEILFQAAQSALAMETGKVRLESVQARLAMCLYLLHTSRPNQAWYTFGTTVQLIMALGMHRARDPSMQMDAITTECRKRAFWAAFTLDTYLSVILGRPPLIHNDDVDQHFPEPVDDEAISAAGVRHDSSRKDQVIQASTWHAKITRIAKKASKELYSVHRNQDAHNVATRLNAEAAEWRAGLPVVLSGAIHPSSLIQIFQRQIVVLDLAHAHAVILINRPLLLIESHLDNSSNVSACLAAAKSTLDIVLGFVSNRRTFPAFWYTQYVTFTALSVVYVWLIQRKRGRLSSLTPPVKDDELYQIAETIQKHLAEATQTNAPSLRYSIILEELQQETYRLMVKQNQSRPPALSGLLDTQTESHPYAVPLSQTEGSPLSNRASTTWDSLSGDFPVDPDLWLQLDSFPFPDFEFDQMNEMT